MPLTALPGRLRRALIASLLLLLASVGLAGFSATLRSQAEAASRAADARLAEVEKRLREAEAVDRQTRETLQAYQRLQGDGGPRGLDRLGWLEQLRAAAARLEVAGFRYEIGPERPLADEGEQSALFVSTLHFEGRFRHEEQFLALLTALQQTPASLLVRRCSLRREPAAAGDEALPALFGSCDIDGLTLHGAPP